MEPGLSPSARLPESRRRSGDRLVSFGAQYRVARATLSPCAAHSYRQSGSKYFWMPDKYCCQRPEKLLQRHDAESTLKDSVDAIVMHYPYIVRQAAGNANHRFMIFFFRHTATPIGTFTANTLAINPPSSPVTTSVQSRDMSSVLSAAVTISIPLRNSAPRAINAAPIPLCRAPFAPGAAFTSTFSDFYDASA